jgi:nucleoside-diphosphate-sugar epimerase
MSATKNVVITSANCVTAGLLIPILKAKGFYTTGLIRKPATLATDETITNWMDSEKARMALVNADYIIHLSGEINAKKKSAYKEANVKTTQIVADMTKGSNAKRIIFLSYPNAVIHHNNYYLHYKAEAERLLVNTQKEVIIFRCPVIIDSPDKPSRIDTLFIAKNGKGVPVIGNGNQKMHPVYRGDVVNAIVAALDKGKPGIHELSGAEEMTINEFIRIVNQNPQVKINHTPALLAKILSRFIPTLSSTFVDIMLNHTNSIYVPEVYREFGIAPASITSMWNKSRQISR